ncbi:uncharacterized protein LOC143155032 [Ptiloglossa arizonensis]|uniref:uncharacterized protein LOC143155032 n=1 Tax=Ptiloglossa arizonensis TaxID=3350558 RepID=UPI003FA0B887
MKRLTNRYYSQYESSIESEPFYDSDNVDTHKRLMESSSEVTFWQYIEHRNNEELLHKYWKLRLRKQTNLAKEIKERCGMAVNLADNRVQYIYKPVINGTPVKDIKFKITFIYIKLIRRWFISLGHTRLPEVIKLHNKIKRGIYDPLGQKVLKMVREVKFLLKIFVHRLIYIYEMIDKVKKVYGKIEFQVSQSLTNVKVLLKEKGWPKSIDKTSPADIIILELILNENLEIENLTYEYIISDEVSEEMKKMYNNKLEKKLKTFFNFPLKEGFEMFMN